MDLQKLSDSIGLIYELPLNPSKWFEVQEVLSRQTNTIGHHVVVFDQDIQVTSSSMFSLWGEEFAAEADKEYKDYYYQFDAGKTIEYSKKQLGQVITNDQITTSYEKRTCPLHNDFNQKFQCQQQIIVGENVNDSFIGIISTRPDGSSFKDTEKQTFHIFSQHILRAIGQSNRLQDMFGDQFSYEHIMHDQKHATIILDEQLNIVWLNKTSKTLLSSPGDLSYKDGKLVINKLGFAAELKQTVKNAVSESEKDKEKCVLYKIQQDEQILAMAIFSSQRKTVFASDKSRVATIMIRLPAKLSAESAEKLKLLFDLTPSEAKLAIAIASGTSLNDYSASEHKSIHTVRSAAKRILSKTNTRSQPELVGVILGRL